MEAIVFIILQIFYATRAVLKIGEYPRIFPSFSWGIFTHVTRLDQSRASDNIWWIIITSKHIQNVPFVHALRTKSNETLRKMCNLPYFFLSVFCSPPLADLFCLCFLEVTEDGFSSSFHNISPQHLKGVVVIALHLKVFLGGFLFQLLIRIQCQKPFLIQLLIFPTCMVMFHGITVFVSKSLSPLNTRKK